jgi:hypothetical protein
VEKLFGFDEACPRKRLHHVIGYKTRTKTLRRSQLTNPAAAYMASAGSFDASTANASRSMLSRAQIHCAYRVISKPNPRPRRSGTTPM